jgi:uncharacterized protein (TIGR00725 family)
MPIVSVFGSSTLPADGPDYADALACGRKLAEAGYTVATGGYGGAMEAVSRGAAEAGGRVIGVTAPGVFPGRAGANAWVAEERPAETLTERIHDMVAISAAFIALDGSIGTLTELLVAWNVAYVEDHFGNGARPVMAVGPRWERLVPELTETVATDGALVVCVPDAAAAVAEVVRRVPR